MRADQRHGVVLRGIVNDDDFVRSGLALKRVEARADMRGAVVGDNNDGN
jgi:hypothetical protein